VGQHFLKRLDAARRLTCLGLAAFLANIIIATIWLPRVAAAGQHPALIGRRRPHVLLDCLFRSSSSFVLKISMVDIDEILAAAIRTAWLQVNGRSLGR